jgi:hypothetical protein
MTEAFRQRGRKAESLRDISPYEPDGRGNGTRFANAQPFEPQPLNGRSHQTRRCPMKCTNSLFAGSALAAALFGCASYPIPVQRMADAEAAARTAKEAGATSNPQAQLHLKLAQEEIALARGLIDNGDNERADFVLIRARSDAELALGEAHAQTAQAEAQRVLEQLAETQARGVAPSTSTTTTTSATVTTPVSPTPGTSTTTTTTTTKEEKP